MEHGASEAGGNRRDPPHPTAGRVDGFSIEEQFRLVVEGAPNGILMVDHDGKIVLANAAVARMFGYSREELLGEPIEVLVPERYRAAHPGHRHGFFRDPKTRAMGAGRDLHAIRKDGSEFPVEIGLNPVTTDLGTLVLASVIDISERKRAEERFRLVVEGAPNGVVMIDRDGRIVLVNPAVEKLFGYARSELLGRPIEMLVPERFRGRHPEHREAFVKDPQARAMGAGRELFGIRKDGSEFPVEIGLNPMQTDEGLFVLSAIVDITERKTAEAALREQDRRKDHFLAMLAHELRNPLAPLKNALYVLGKSSSVPKEDAVVVAMMDRQVNHLARLVDDLLDVSRISRGKINLRMATLDLANLVETNLADHHRALDDARLAVEASVPDRPVWVRGDGTRLTQVLDNLVGNTIKFTDPGGRLSVRLTAGGGRAVLTVEDTGIGIEPEMLPRVFETFAQADRSLDRSRGGLGLGLSLAKGLVELHGGTITAASAGTGRGATFTIELPTTAEPPALVERRVRPTRVTRHIKVLVVEDNRDSAESLRALLELAGYSVSTAYSGSEGIDAARAFVPHVVLCDIGLPGMDGFAVAETLRRTQETAATKLIAVTGYGQEADRERALRAGFDRHLVKPVDPDQLLLELADLRA